MPVATVRSIKMAMEIIMVPKIEIDIWIEVRIIKWIVVRIVVRIVVGIIVIIRLTVVGRCYHATTASKNQNCHNK